MSYRLILLFTALTLAGSQAQAKDPHKPAPSKGPEIIAHVPLNGEATVQMFTRRDAKGRLYLYALHPSGSAVSVVDITDAARSAVVSQVAYPSPAGYGNVQTIGANTALVELADQPAAAPDKAVPGKTLALLDISNPAAPAITLRFEGVTSVYRDDSRNLIFLANNQGLWIVRHYEPPDIGVRAWEEFVAGR